MAFNFKKLKILIADDDTSMRDMMAAILQKFEFQTVDAAKSGRECLELFKAGKHDVIITDWQMDEMDGIELIQEIRQSESPDVDRAVPIILATGYTNSEMVRKARDAGTTEFLVKPFSADDLAKRIAYVMNKPREFVEIKNYTGPDRRRIDRKNYNGPFRREADQNG